MRARITQAVFVLYALSDIDYRAISGRWPQRHIPKRRMNSATVVQIQQPADEQLPTGFDAFWTLFPRRVAKKDARRAWDRINPAEHPEILSALVSWRRIWLKRGELEFVPYPATWLNGERWTDELPTATVTPISASHVTFEPTKPVTKAGYTPEVAAALRAALGKRP